MARVWMEPTPQEMPAQASDLLHHGNRGHQGESTSARTVAAPHIGHDDVRAGTEPPHNVDPHYPPTSVAEDARSIGAATDIGLRWLGRLVFTSRWLQAPLYAGLVIAQALYIFHFVEHLLHQEWGTDERSMIMVVLGLIDAAMVANLLLMVIVGGYELFVSRIKGIEDHPDKPQWLTHINSNLLKLKLAMAIIGISSIDLLQTFINLRGVVERPLGVTEIIWQIAIHLALVLSAFVIAVIGRMTDAH